MLNLPPEKPVKVSIHHDLSIELHGDNFSVKRVLSVDEALGLIGMLSYVVREQLYKQPSPLVEVAK
jgi:hypothetical protein